MRNRLLLLGLAAAVALLLAAPAMADEAVDHEHGMLTALVGDVGYRVVQSVGAPIATVKDDGDIVRTGTPTEVVVAELSAAGGTWSVQLTLDDDLEDVTDSENFIEKAKVSATSTTSSPAGPGLINLLDPEGTLGLPGPTTNSMSPAAETPVTGALGSALQLYEVTQSGGFLYTGTYTSSVGFEVDATGYAGGLATMTAPFTVTIQQ